MGLQKHWYLGFLGVIGIYELPAIVDAARGGGALWHLSGALWFLWFMHFLPDGTARDANQGTRQQKGEKHDER